MIAVLKLFFVCAWSAECESIVAAAVAYGLGVRDAVQYMYLVGAEHMRQRKVKLAVSCLKEFDKKGRSTVIRSWEVMCVCVFACALVCASKSHVMQSFQLPNGIFLKR